MRDCKARKKRKRATVGLVPRPIVMSVKLKLEGRERETEDPTWLAQPLFHFSRLQLKKVKKKRTNQNKLGLERNDPVYRRLNLNLVAGAATLLS
jgi:hypothetical protein